MHPVSKKHRSFLFPFFAAGDLRRWRERLVKMSMILKIRAESGLLRVIATGEFSLEEAESTFLEILDAVARHKTPKILFDGRGLNGEPSTIEHFF
jgi:hypothetical protein